jgi:hypothetical protein
MTDSRDPEDIMRELWAKFLASNPGPEFKPWDEMDERERSVMRAVVRQTGADPVRHRLLNRD